MGMSVTDTIFVSAFFGTEALAAIAVGSDLYSIVFYLCAGVLAGIAPFYTAAVTQANTPERARSSGSGGRRPLIWLSPVWLEDFGIQQTLLTNGRGYTRAMALTLVPMLGVILYRTVLTAAEKPSVFLKVTLAMLPLNAIGNYVFMTGVGPIPSFGPTGAGISSLIVAVASLAILVIVVRRATPRSVSQLSGEATTDWRGLAGVLRVGIPIGIATDGSLLQSSMVRMARAESLHDTGACRALIFSSLGLSAIFGAAIFLMLAVTVEPFATAFFDDSAAGIAAMQLAAIC